MEKEKKGKNQRIVIVNRKEKTTRRITLVVLVQKKILK